MNSYRKNCDRKSCYTHICKAIQHAYLLMDQMALVKYPKVVYWCDKHSGYHVGGDRSMTPEARKVYESAAWSRGRELRLRSGLNDCPQEDPIVESTNRSGGI